MNKAILSARFPQFAERLRALGFTVIPTDSIPCKMPYERDHADLQCLILDDTAFVLSPCKSVAGALSSDYNVVLCGRDYGEEYPKNVCLNAIRSGKNLICRVPSLDRNVREYAEKHGYTLTHVNQGYAACSCAKAADNALITADKGVYHSLKESNDDILLIGQGRVKLEGADCGFIGGASGYCQATNTLYFCGSIDSHPDADRIREFCDRRRTNIISLTQDELTDIGGIIFC